MILCPYAALSSCSKCPIKKVCLLKGVIGDYKKPKNNAKNTDNNDK
jgi:hypothetical protein